MHYQLHDCIVTTVLEIPDL